MSDDQIIDHEKTLALKVDMLQGQVVELERKLTDLMRIIIAQPFALGHTLHGWYDVDERDAGNATREGG